MQNKSEDEMKGLEAEIESAIDRLFVDKNHEMSKTSSEGSGVPDPSGKIALPLPRHPEPLEDQEFSFPPLPELSDHFSEPFEEKEISVVQDSAPSEESDFFLSDPSQDSHGEKDSLSGLTMPLFETEDLSSYPSDIPFHERILSSPGSKPLHEKEFFFPHSESSDEPKVSFQPLSSSSSYEMDMSSPSSPDTSPDTSSLPEAFERMETQLLSTEWEITDTNLRKTKEEVAASKVDFKGKPDVLHVLGLMEQVLDCMIRKEMEIRPSMVKFLMDAKETVRLLLRLESSGEIGIYKQLAYAGIESRFSCLGSEERSRESEGTEEIGVWDRMEGLASRISVLEEKMEGMLQDWENHLSSSRSSGAETKGRPVNVTVFQVGGKLLGVETERICKLFKISNRLDPRYLNQGKIRLKDLAVKIVDLKKILAIEGGEENQECKILVIKDEEEYKGFMLDQVIKNLSWYETTNGKQNEYFSGTIHWTYQDRPVEIPILDLKQMISL